MSDEAIRLSKRVALLAACSRADAERYIDGGWVRVDGVVVESPQARVGPAQAVTIDPGASLLPQPPVTILFHQPAGQALAWPQPQDRWPQDRSGIRPLQSHFRRPQPLLALPEGGSGLAVFSHDRRIIRKLEEDALEIEQELVVEVSGQIADGGLARLASGLRMEGRPLPPMKVSWQSERKLRFALKGIDAGWVPWMCQQVGLAAMQVHRLRIGRLPLAGLPAGQWRYLLPHERF